MVLAPTKVTPTTATMIMKISFPVDHMVQNIPITVSARTI